MKLKYYFYSIIINIILLGLLYLFVIEPIKMFAELSAKSWCNAWKLECNFKK